MNRRQFIQRVTAALAAAGFVHSLPSGLEASLPKVIPPGFKLSTGIESAFRIAMPDGTVFSFSGVVTANAPVHSVDGLEEVSLQIQLTGPTTISVETVDGSVCAISTETVRATGTELVRIDPDGAESAPIQIVSIGSGHSALSGLCFRRRGSPRLSYHQQISDDEIPGMRRMGSITITGNFQSED